MTAAMYSLPWEDRPSCDQGFALGSADAQCNFLVRNSMECSLRVIKLESLELAVACCSLSVMQLESPGLAAAWCKLLVKEMTEWSLKPGGLESLWLAAAWYSLHVKSTMGCNLEIVKLVSLVMFEADLAAL